MNASNVSTRPTRRNLFRGTIAAGALAATGAAVASPPPIHTADERLMGISAMIYHLHDKLDDLPAEGQEKAVEAIIERIDELFLKAMPLRPKTPQGFAAKARIAGAGLDTDKERALVQWLLSDLIIAGRA